jgi:hypothetical protein
MNDAESSFETTFVDRNTDEAIYAFGRLRQAERRVERLRRELERILIRGINISTYVKATEDDYQRQG